VCVCVCVTHILYRWTVLLRLEQAGNAPFVCYCKRDQYWTNKVEQLTLATLCKKEHDTKYGGKYLHHML